MSNHKKRSKKLPTRALADVTINDFANSTVTKSRLKKSSNNVKLAVKQMQVDNPAWYEKVEDYEGDFDFIEEENEDGTVSVVIKKKETRRKTITECDISQGAGGNNYPIDIWFLISDYIRPEDVGTFGAICKTALAVIYSAKFWFKLYKRFYATNYLLPERLQPECMVRLYGLRACVIRALYYMYTPFLDRLISVYPLEQTEGVLRRKCILMWHKKTKKHWMYFFKLKRYSELDRLVTQSRCSRKPDLLEMLEDISANQDDNCRILQVTCLHFVAIPPVLGLTLSAINLPLSQGFILNRMQLNFSSGVISRSNNFSGDVNSNSVIVFDPLHSIKVLDWWHPLYPHTDTMVDLLYQE